MKSGTAVRDAVNDVAAIRQILAQHGWLGVDVYSLKSDCNLYHAGLTSLATVNVMLALESHFDIEFPDSMLGRKTFATIESIAQAIADLVSQPPNSLPQDRPMPDFQAADGGNQAFQRLLHKAHGLGKDVLAACAAEVDRDARFPRESLDAIKQARLLSAYVPREYGGMGLNVLQVARLCEALGQYCGSSAMIYAMHMIQVACVVHHAQQSAYFQDYLRQLVEEQRLVASATTELGVGGDLRTSLCAVEVVGDTFRLTKKAPVISYGEAADDILVTCRHAPHVAASDQVQVLVRREDYTTEPLSGWDTLGFRGTCSSGFTLTARGKAEQILPTPFADILQQTMHPYSHIVWSSLWSGIATDAVNRARAFVRAEARKTPGETPLSALRLAEVDGLLQELRHNVANHTCEYHELLTQGQPEAFSQFGFAVRTNNLKITSSQRVVDIVGRAMLICGIAGYRNDSKYSLGRHLRDAYGAALMVNNDRIMKLNATMLLAHREG